ncbi:XRE family transcriptional regulator [Streptomyces minutiscleroticus]|uniref:HTH cro/C1-type domain-containing protein n=1 Tax=Streptomyces minutiscleroticus TaxID=68238 RepID=A0A918NEU7_9ACTN|nr:XRE family transcriptional regulator [Streptomyces minutiscleroticus]GGX67706.1 hypothetical protein GCM10010358_22630 [Streptomyces minutiscleroticus]
MPRWKALPDELDPQLKEFAGQLRRLVDRSGLSIAAVADRTGYSKTSWERYLNGRLLAPKGAIVALAEVTGTNPVHLTTMWELAERAWSRSEMRHDMTMEAIRISQARAALGETGPTRAGEVRGGRKGGGAAAPGAAGTAPAVPPQGPQPGEERAGRTGVPGEHGPAAARAGVGSWGVPVQPPGGPAVAPPPYVTHQGRPPGGTPPRDARPAARPEPPQGDGGKRRVSMFVAGVVGALVVVALAVYLTAGGGTKSEADPSPSPTASRKLPAGVECSGADCTGQDPEKMGCGGDLATTAGSVTVGTAVVEVRYSETCEAAWARITQAALGDEVRVTADGAEAQRGKVENATDAYTPMVAVKDAGDANACAFLQNGRQGCTK